MWSETPQKWQTGTNLGTSVFLTANLGSDFSFSQKIGVIPQIHSASHGFSPTKSKTCARLVRKDSLRWVLLTCP